jgi:hypothetical protein
MNKNTIRITFLLIIPSILFILLFGKILAHPNGYIFSGTIDAVKNYFNFSWYLQYGGGIIHEGINYPYGDHLQYINSHPLYIQIIKGIDRYIYDLSDNAVAVLNLTMIFSLFAAIPFIYLILRKFSLPRLYAGTMALLILFLSPQLDRIPGHFEMVYAFFIPMYWYLLIRFREKSNPWLWGTLLVLTALTGGFTSAYYVAFFMLLTISVLFTDILFNLKNIRPRLSELIQLLVIAVLPVMVVQGVVQLTDIVTDRPVNPWGFYKFHSDFRSIFFPVSSPLVDLLKDFADMRYEWEGYAYVGFVGTLVGIATLVAMGIRWRKNGFGGLVSRMRRNRLSLFVAASLFTLMFAMCQPFKLGMDFILDWIPPIRQFRALGRFSWLFYYIFTVFAAWYIYRFYRYLRLKEMKNLAVLFMTAALLFWFIDAGVNVKRSIHDIFNKNLKLENKSDQYLSHFELSGFKPDTFQAILAVPFASTCGDKMLFEHGENALTEAMKYAHHTGLPLLQSFEPRLSYSIALTSIQMLADSAIARTRLDDMNEKPLLLLRSKQKLTSQEEWVFSKSKPFFEDDKVILSYLPVEVFHQSHYAWKNYVAATLTELPGNRLKSDVDSSILIHDHFQTRECQNAFADPGALHLEKGVITLYEGAIERSQYEVWEASFWLFFDTRTDNMPEAYITLTDSLGKEEKAVKLKTRDEHNVFGTWVRIAGQFKPLPGGKIKIWLKGKLITADNLLIRPAGSRVFIENEQGISLYNNFPYVPSEDQH